MIQKVKRFEEFIKSLNEIADWDDPTQKDKDRDTISCDDDERYERDTLKKAISKEYKNWYKPSEIDDAIKYCCNKEGQSRKREEFTRCVLNRLNLTK